MDEWGRKWIKGQRDGLPFQLAFEWNGHEKRVDEQQKKKKEKNKKGLAVIGIEMKRWWSETGLLNAFNVLSMGLETIQFLYIHIYVEIYIPISRSFQVFPFNWEIPCFHITIQIRNGKSESSLMVLFETIFFMNWKIKEEKILRIYS